MHPTHIQTALVTQFRCLGADCPDTCCQGWGMQLHDDTLALYAARAPELLDAVTTTEHGVSLMKRDPATDGCVKLEAGWCAIHRDYGAAFLGEACRLFPRITRALGSYVLTSGMLSCPQVAAAALLEEGALDFSPEQAVDAPFVLRNYLPQGLREEGALAIHRALLDVALTPSATAEHNLLRISATARALEMQPVTVWEEALSLYLTLAEGRIPAAEPALADPFHLLQALYGLYRASGTHHARLEALILAVADQLGVSFPAHGGMVLAENAASRALAQRHHMRAQAAHLQPLLRRYVAAQLAQTLFPFAGLGETLTQRVTILGVRLASLKLLLASLPEEPPLAQAASVAQALSRLSDHLPDASLLLQMYEETGWVREPRLRALLGDGI